jgi:branched-chain amino acid aminotransferase
MSAPFTWMNGEVIPTEKATVPFLNVGLHYGIGAFEGIRCYETEQGPQIFRLHEHMVRLADSCKILGWLELPYTVAQLEDACREIITANNLKACYIRPMVYLAEGGMNLNMDTGKPHFAIAVWEWTAFFSEEAAEKGIRANVSSYTRHHPNVMMTKAKIAGNYPNSVMAKTESIRNGFDEAIMLDPQGYVAECAAQNLFIVRDGVLITSPSATILEGITRDSIMVLAKDMGYEVKEQPISRDQLYRSDEVFATGTAAEVVAIAEIDHRKIGEGRMGPVTRKLQQAFHQTVQGKHARSAGWLTPVQAPAAVGSR